jgi:hypothetical protein
VGGWCEILLFLAPTPALSDCERFPPQAFATAALEFNRAYRDHLEAEQAFEVRRWGDWQDSIWETDYLYHCWSALAAARGTEGRDEDSRRAALVRLRDLIGEEAYFQGAMPPCVPLWRFWIVN